VTLARHYLVSLN